MAVPEFPHPFALSQPGARGRASNECEDQVFLFWERNHLSTTSYTQGNLIAFLNQLKSLF